MADYKEMYLAMVRASEKAVRVLIEAQQRCEEMYIGAEEEHPAVFDFHDPRGPGGG
ncbi:MAG TPA: hypothetical protein PLP20_00630 [Oscillospiraceae bacterium]|nr:hypothetical protein [Oscillospiraceae bacterium]HNW04001.1 hypothetical protein [Oscillospiraceae bacterium]HPV99548.1 hypothetical protein [Oscillospiraceae bacterium]